MQTETILDPTRHPQTFDTTAGLLTIWPDGSETLTTIVNGKRSVELEPHVSEHRDEARRIITDLLIGDNMLSSSRVFAAEIVDALTLAGIIR
jgi:hypothetical protein